MKKNKHVLKKLFRKENETEQTKPMRRSKSTKKVLAKNSFAKKKSQIGPFLTATFTAILIGLFLGLMMLNMFTNKENQASMSDDQPVPVHEGEDVSVTDKIEMKSTTLKQMNAYVLQLGVFSEPENANDWSDTYQLEGFPSIHFQRENQYFLFGGIAHTKEKAKELAALLLNNDIEVYVKEWTINEIEIELTEEESEWLKRFQEQWEETLQSLSAQEEIMLEWGDLTENYPLKSEEITQLVIAMQALLENEGKVKDDFELQYHLLNIWKVYGETFKNS